jgi:hypothetical protein
MADIDCLRIIFVGTKRAIGNDIISVMLGLNAWLNNDVLAFLSDVSQAGICLLVIGCMYKWLLWRVDS